MMAQSSAESTDAAIQSSTTSNDTGTSTTSVVPPEAKKPKAGPKAKPYPKGKSAAKASEFVGPIPGAVPPEFKAAYLDHTMEFSVHAPNDSIADEELGDVLLQGQRQSPCACTD